MGRRPATDGPTLDQSGRYRRDCGRKADGSQHRFYLGRDRADATIRGLQLERIWSGVVRRWERVRATDARNNARDEWELSQQDRPVWDETSMAVAQAVARGEHTVALPVPRLGVAMCRAGSSVREWYDWTDFDVYKGSGPNPDYLAAWLREARMDWPSLRIDIVDTMAQAKAQAVNDQRLAQARAIVEESQAVPQPAPSGQTLHMALDAYSVWIGQEYTVPRSVPARPTQHARCLQRYAALMKRHHDDIALDLLGLSQLEAMVRYWHSRPTGKRGTPIAQATATDMAKQVRAFVAWLHRASEWRWRQPEDWTTSKRGRVAVLPGERAARVTAQQVETYTVDELAILYRHATDWERSLLVLGLNTAFGRGELSTLMLEEINLDGDPPMIKRLRSKTDVYGEWVLWPETVRAIRWLRDKRRRAGARCPELVVSTRGRPLHETTAGNPNMLVNNAWVALNDRIAAERPGWRRLSFGKVRKTSADLVRQIAGEAIASVHLAHGRAAGEDALLAVYTNPRFADLHRALGQLRERLAPVFEQQLAQASGEAQ